MAFVRLKKVAVRGNGKLNRNYCFIDALSRYIVCVCVGENGIPQFIHFVTELRIKMNSQCNGCATVHEETK